MEAQEITNLVGITGCQDHLIAPIAKLLDNRYEERNVRGIIQINPNLLQPRRASRMHVLRGVLTRYRRLQLPLSCTRNHEIPERQILYSSADGYQKGGWISRSGLLSDVVSQRTFGQSFGNFFLLLWSQSGIHWERQTLLC